MADYGRLWQTMADYGRLWQTMAVRSKHKQKIPLINIKTYKGLEEAGK